MQPNPLAKILLLKLIKFGQNQNLASPKTSDSYTRGTGLLIYIITDHSRWRLDAVIQYIYRKKSIRSSTNKKERLFLELSRFLNHYD